MDKKKINVAIDGTSSSGKSTMAKALAKSVGYTYIDTGAMYRSVALFCLRHGLITDGKVDVERLLPMLPDINISFKIEDGKQITYLNGENVENEIRGLEVLPDAEIKLYVTTSPEIRAKRRFDEMRAKGDTSVTLDDIIANVKMRDHLDTTRKESPLRKADDAVEVDSGKFATAEEQIAWAVDYFHQFMQGKNI